KEFAFGERVETRYMVHTAAGWRFATYLADGTRAPREGKDLGFHQIPAASDCLGCHGNGRTPVLGYSAVQLGKKEIPGSELQKKALGYLHGNCGHCHQS